MGVSVKWLLDVRVQLYDKQQLHSSTTDGILLCLNPESEYKHVSVNITGAADRSWLCRPRTPASSRFEWASPCSTPRAAASCTRLGPGNRTRTRGRHKGLYFPADRRHRGVRAAQLLWWTAAWLEPRCPRWHLWQEGGQQIIRKCVSILCLCCIKASQLKSDQHLTPKLQILRGDIFLLMLDVDCYFFHISRSGWWWGRKPVKG